jgi:ABC-type multidrug transport system fused ATPase/permease subunit
MNTKKWVIPFLVKKVFTYTGKRKKHFILGIFLVSLVQIFHALDPLFIGLAINKAQEIGVDKSTLPSILFYIALVPLSGICAWITSYFARTLEFKNAFIIQKNYNESLLKSTFHFPLQWHANNHSGSTLDKINRATGALNNFVNNLDMLLYIVVNMIVSFVALLVFNIHSIYIAIFFATIIISFVLKMDKKIVPIYDKLNRAYNFMSGKIHDAINNIQTIIILRIRKQILKQITSVLNKPLQPFDKSNKLSEFKWSAMGILNNLMIFTITASYIIVLVAREEAIMYGTLATLFGYASQMSGAVSTIAYNYSSFVRARTDIENAKEIEEHSKKIEKIKQIKLKNWKLINISNLDFKYEDAKHHKLHIKNIELCIKHKQKIAFIGESGSGKTTTLKLLRELYDPKRSKVTLDNKVLPHGLAQLSNDIALIPQEPEIFNTTIKNNITFGLHTSLQEVRRYARITKFDKVVMKLPNKYNSSIQEKGVNLSGGEKQRLALARGLFASKHKEIILLDEPTSSVDTINELDIFKSIFKVLKNKTIIASIHRLHLLNLFDYIYIFKDGKIIGEGTYTELKRTNKEFIHLLKKYQQSR